MLVNIELPIWAPPEAGSIQYDTNKQVFREISPDGYATEKTLEEIQDSRTQEYLLEKVQERVVSTKQPHRKKLLLL